MPIHGKSGKMFEVNWAGSTMSINYRANSGKLSVYVFVATLENCDFLTI